MSEVKVLNVEMGGRNLDKEDGVSIEKIVPEDIKKEIENTKHEVFGKGENSFIAFPKPIKKTQEVQFDYMPNGRIKVHKEKFLLLINNEKGEISKKVLTFQIYQNELGDNYSQTRALDDYTKLMQESTEKEKRECSFKKIGEDEILSFPPHTAHSKKSFDINKVSVTDIKEFWLENANEIEYKNVLDVNKKEA